MTGKVPSHILRFWHTLAVLLDKMHNTHRKRQRPMQASAATTPSALTPNAVELAYAQQQASLLVKPLQEK